jgi:hypothetical protein
LAANKPAVSAEKRAAIPPVAIIIAAAVVLGGAGFAYLNYLSNKPSAPPPPLTGDAKAYVKFLRFVAADGQTPESPEMTAHESYLKQAVVEITGNLLNTGDRVLDQVEITCVFYDPYNQEVYRERVPIVSKKMGKLAPGQTKHFRLAFDNIPEGWNQAMPTMVIAGIEFS